MKKLALLLFLSLLCAVPTFAQLPLTQNWNEVVTLAPPALNSTQSFSNASFTGFSQSTTGGSIAAGTYRCGVTLFTSSNTETPLSTDTAVTSTITTTGSTSSVTIQAPLTSGAAGNIVGWRPYCGVTGGATGAETLVVINSTVCPLSSSSTPSCSLNSPAVLTLQSQFAAGSGGPATPGTAVFPPIANQASQALFENSQITYRVINWVVTGTSPSACTFNVQSGATIGALASVGQTITCTSSGSYAVPYSTKIAFTSINLATYTAGDTTTAVAFYYAGYQFNPGGSLYFGNAVPTGTCLTGGTYLNTGGAVSTSVYTCNAGTWTAVTVP